MSEVIKTETAAVVLTPAERDFALAQREAVALSSSDRIPKEYQGNVPNCLIAYNMANRIGADPLMVMQSLYIVQGKPSFSASFLIGCFNTCGRFTPIQYRVTGEGADRTWVAHTTDRETGVEIEGPPVTMQMAKDEGWSTKSGSKWKSMPELMGRYRSATFLIRTTAPEIALGMHTSDEIEDIQPGRASQGASATAAAEALSNARDITPKDQAPLVAEPDSQSEEFRDVSPPAGDSDDVDAAFGLSGDEAA